jgi:hypothetical protein
VVEVPGIFGVGSPVKAWKVLVPVTAEEYRATGAKLGVRNHDFARDADVGCPWRVGVEDSVGVDAEGA